MGSATSLGFNLWNYPSRNGSPPAKYHPFSPWFRGTMLRKLGSVVKRYLTIIQHHKATFAIIPLSRWQNNPQWYSWVWALGIGIGQIIRIMKFPTWFVSGENFMDIDINITNQTGQTKGKYKVGPPVLGVGLQAHLISVYSNFPIKLWFCGYSRKDRELYNLMYGSLML